MLWNVDRKHQTLHLFWISRIFFIKDLLLCFFYGFPYIIKVLTCFLNNRKLLFFFTTEREVVQGKSDVSNRQQTHICVKSCETLQRGSFVDDSSSQQETGNCPEQVTVKTLLSQHCVTGTAPQVSGKASWWKIASGVQQIRFGCLGESSADILFYHNKEDGTLNRHTSPTEWPSHQPNLWRGKQ